MKGKTIFCLLFALFLLTFVSYGIEISAKSAVVIESQSGDIVFEKNKEKEMKMASTTKIMTAIIAIERGDLDKTITISKEETNIEGSSIYLKEGEVLTLRDLLYALLLESANDVSMAIAKEIGTTIPSFVEMMNDKAVELGLTHTHFDNPSGLDSDTHYSCAYDLAKLGNYCMKNKTFADIVSTQKQTIPSPDGTRVLVNHNKLLRADQNVVGIKTGYTKKSGRCLVSCMEKDGVRLICVTLDAPNDWNDHKALYETSCPLYESISLAKQGSYMISLPVINGQKSKIVCANFDDYSYTVKKGTADISAKLEIDQMNFAPILAHTVMGKIVFYNHQEKIGELPLYALNDVPDIHYQKSLLERIFK